MSISSKSFLPPKVKQGPGIKAILAIPDKKLQEEFIFERLNDIKDWHVRLTRNAGEYSLPETTISTMLNCISDVIHIADYFKEHGGPIANTPDNNH
jgi:hypothetical protein